MFTFNPNFVIMLNGDYMEQSNLELFYDVLDDSINYLYEITKKDYMSLILLTCKNIIAGEVLNDFEEKQVKKLTEIYSKLEEIDFSVEDIRKSIQAIILKGFKETRMLNGHTTPDTIGMFYAYLISRFNKDNKQLKLLDPLIGTGNLVFSLVNHLQLDLELYGIDHDELMIKLTKDTSELLQQEISLYYQDTLSLNLKDMDFIVFDINNYDNMEKYFPYEVILHHQNSLKENGYMISLVPEDFFDYDTNQEFKKELLKDMSIVSIIELPSSMFVGQAKSIIVFKKAKIDHKKCLMVKLPSFNDPKEFNKSLVQIETWFENNL